MKHLHIKTQTIETYTIDYENDIFCDVQLTNSELTQYRFYTILSDKRINLYYHPNIDSLLKIHWGEHHKLLFDYNPNKEIHSLDLIQIESFNEFDLLYYIGMSMDGMVKDRNGKALSSVIIVDYITNKIYSEINTLEKSKAFKEKADKIDWVLKCDIVEIPSYNRDDDEGDTHSVRYEVLLPQDIFDTVLGEKPHIDDYVTKNITDLILSI